jgi:hypothetical protein
MKPPPNLVLQKEKFEHWFTPAKVDSYSMALSDIICWMDGFVSAGGIYHAQSIEQLRDLNIGLKNIYRENLTGDSQSHT